MQVPLVVKTIRHKKIHIVENPVTKSQYFFISVSVCASELIKESAGDDLALSCPLDAKYDQSNFKVFYLKIYYSDPCNHVGVLQNHF